MLKEARHKYLVYSQSNTFIHLREKESLFYRIYLISNPSFRKERHKYSVREERKGKQKPALRPVSWTESREAWIRTDYSHTVGKRKYLMYIYTMHPSMWKSTCVNISRVSKSDNACCICNPFLDTDKYNRHVLVSEINIIHRIPPKEWRDSVHD